MSLDIQVISVVDELQILRVEDIEGATPRTLRVTGKGGFNSAQRVLINDYGIDSFVLVSDTVLLVAPGRVLENVPVTQMSIVVVSGQLTGTRRVRLLFGPTRRLQKVSGAQRLVQTVVKVLLTNVGSNRFRPQEGGNLLRLMSFPLLPEAKPRLVTALTQGIVATESQIVAAQSRARSIPSEERLLSLSLGGVTFVSETLEVQAPIRLTTFRGRALEVPLVL